MRVEIWSDVVCPWCYIGKRRFERALAEDPAGEEVEVVYRPLQLDPGASEASIPILQYLERRFGAGAPSMTARVSEIAAGEGLVIDWDRALMANTWSAHRLLRLAAVEYGAAVQRRLMEALFAGHFTRGLDIADRGELTGLAAAAGMDGDRAAAYLASDEGSADLQAELNLARSLGIRSVPTFVFDGQLALEGAQSIATFSEVLLEVQARAAAATE